MHYQLTTLGNGLRVITEEMPEIRSVAVGCWVVTGSRDETPPEEGSAHFLEHLLFKGTDDLSARAIAEAFDAVGGRSNAFTSREHTCYWARLRDADLEMGLDILAQMLRAPAFRDTEIESERHVVLEEINMNEDDPTDVAQEEFAAAVWEGHDLERPVLGTRQSITAMTRDDIRGYWGRRYHPATVVVAVAGNVDHDEVVAMAQGGFGDWQGDHPPRSVGGTDVRPQARVRRRDTEQTHLIVGGRGPSRGDDRRFAYSLLNHVLGSGMSSRLFREIREERGLAYAVYGFGLPQLDSGAWGVYVGTTPSQTTQVLDIINTELAKVIANGITAEELDRAKSHAQGALALSTEDANSRMIKLGRHEVSGVEHLSVDETLARFDAVTLGEIKQLAGEIYDAPRVIGAVGPFDPDDLMPFVA